MASKQTDDPGEVAIPDAIADMTGDERGSEFASNELARFITEEQGETSDDPTATYRQIIDQILSADTPEDVLTPVEAVSARDLVGQEFMLEGFSVNKSEFDVGSPFYASMQCREAGSNARIVINCGDQKVLAQLVRLGQLGALPVPIRIGQAKRQNRFGNFPLRLERTDV